MGAAVVYLLSQRRIQSLRQLAAILEERLQAQSQRAVEQDAAQVELQSAHQELQGTVQAQRDQITTLQTELSHERRQWQEKLTLLQQSRDQMKLEFQQLATEILEDKSRRFTANNQENLTRILGPLQERIQQFEKRVEETYDRESKERFSLAREIRSLQELNQRISTDAVNLTNALKGDNKAQGIWGEMVLESILEKSGLEKGREYDVQVSLKADDGSRQQPDVIVHLPEGKDIVIDAKVSLKAYEAYTAESDPALQAELLRQHVQSIRAHVKGLAERDYHALAGVNSLDFVLLFMPIEASFSVAAQADPGLFHHGFERNIIIVVPSTLLATLRIVHNIWRLAQQNQNAMEIARQAGALYDKFVGFVADLDDVGTRIDAAQKSFERTRNKLSGGRGNLIGRVERLRLLGARTTKRHADAVMQGVETDGDAPLLPNDSEDDDS